MVQFQPFNMMAFEWSLATLMFGRVSALSCSSYFRCCSNERSALEVCTVELCRGRARGDSQPASGADSSPDGPWLCLVCLFVQTLLRSPVSILAPNQVRASPALSCSEQNKFLFLFFPLYFIFRHGCMSALDLCNGVKERFKGEICAGSSKRLCLSHPQRAAAL